MTSSSPSSSNSSNGSTQECNRGTSLLVSFTIAALTVYGTHCSSTYFRSRHLSTTEYEGNETGEAHMSSNWQESERQRLLQQFEAEESSWQEERVEILEQHYRERKAWEEARVKLEQQLIEEELDAPKLKHDGEELRVIAAKTFGSKVDDVREAWLQLYYGRWLPGYRAMKDIKVLHLMDDAVLENGNGGDLLAMWADYFVEPKHIVGYNRGNADVPVPDEGSVTHVGKVVSRKSSSTSLKDLCENFGPFDIIIDGDVAGTGLVDTRRRRTSEHNYDVIDTLVQLTDCVAQGGMYLMEGMDVNYWDVNTSSQGTTGIGAPPPNSAIETLKQMVDVVNRNVMCQSDEDMHILPGKVDTEYCGITFGSNMVKLDKCTKLEKVHGKESCKNAKTAPKGKVNYDEVRGWADRARKMHAK